tara:strand:- start:73404 stop:73532 length:129 start_codon:yes stop_codon:yes gene_type:complete
MKAEYSDSDSECEESVGDVRFDCLTVYDLNHKLVQNFVEFEK